MSNTSERSKNANRTACTPQRQNDSSDVDLRLVAERLSLIQGHISQMPKHICISGVRMYDGYLLVALRVNGHEIGVSGGTWTIDGTDITEYGYCKNE